MFDAGPRLSEAVIRALVVGLAVVTTLALSTVLAAPAMSQAVGAATTTTTTAPSTSTTTTASTDTTTTTAPPTGTSVAANPGPTTSTSSDTPTGTTTTTLAQIPQGPLPANPPPTTTVPPPAATVPPAQTRALLQGLQGTLAQFNAMDAYRRDQIVAVDAGTQAAGADAVVAEAEQAVAVATATRDAAVHTVDSNVRQLSALAVALYVGEGAARTDIADSLDTSTADRQVMLSIVIAGSRSKVKTSRQDVSVADGGLRDATARLGVAEAAQARAHQAVDQAATALAADKAAALGLPAPKAVSTTTSPPATRRKSKIAGATAPPPPASPTIVGPTLLTADELAGWFASMGHAANTTVPMAELAADYIDASRTEGVRGDVAFAQSIIETGYFGFPAAGQVAGTDNNFAGIGACDSCAHGWNFPDARTGVAAQMQLLDSYASTTPVATPLIGKVFVAGCCRTWMALTGVWATAPTYGYEVLTLYKQIVDWALPRRLALAGLAPAPAG